LVGAGRASTTRFRLGIPPEVAAVFRALATLEGTLTLLGAVTGVVAAILLSTHGGPQVTPGITLFQLIGYNLLVISAVLVLGVLFTIFRSSGGLA
jgi:hypothetical protein